MADILRVFPAYFVIFGLIYITILRPAIERKRDNLIFDSSVLSFIDALYLSGMKFGCPDFDMRNYASRILAAAHALPDGKSLLEHTIMSDDLPRWHGYVFRSHIGLHGDHITFALLCVIAYALEHDNLRLVAQCEHLLVESRSMVAHYSRLL